MSDNGVSVVIAAFNATETLDATLASIASQTLKADEVIIGDDASTDNTVELAQRWADHLPITVVRLPVNAGIGPARTAAINASSHDIIATIDADDIWLPDHLETVIPLMTDESTIVGAQPIRWAPGLGLDSSGIGLPPAFPNNEDQVQRILSDNFLFVGSIFSKAALERVGGGSMRRTGEDWDVWIRLIVRGGCRAVQAPHATVLYRMRSDSISAGEGCLPYEVEMLSTLSEDPDYAEHRPLLAQALRRREARTTFLEAAAMSPTKQPNDVRRRYLQAMSQDRSIRGGFGGGTRGSVALRSALGVLSPRLASEMRDRRLIRKRIIQPALDESRFGRDALSKNSDQDSNEGSGPDRQPPHLKIVD